MNNVVVYTVEDVAEKLHIGKRSTYKLMHRPDFPLIKIGAKMYVREKDLDDYLADYVGGNIKL